MGFLTLSFFPAYNKEENKGGVKMEKALIVDLPYPNTEGIKEDFRSASIIAPAYASQHSELGAILQYVYHHFYFEKLGDDETASTLVRISVAEMKHLNLLGEVLIKLGVDPVFTRKPPYKTEFFSSSCISYSKTAKKMLLDDISGEMLAINEYNLMLEKLENEEVSAIIKRILLDEELHLLALKKCMKNLMEFSSNC